MVSYDMYLFSEIQCLFKCSGVLWFNTNVFSKTVVIKSKTICNICFIMWIIVILLFLILSSLILYNVIKFNLNNSFHILANKVVHNRGWLFKLKHGWTIMQYS